MRDITSCSKLADNIIYQVQQLKERIEDPNYPVQLLSVRVDELIGLLESLNLLLGYTKISNPVQKHK